MFFDEINEINSHDPGGVGCLVQVYILYVVLSVQLEQSTRLYSFALDHFMCFSLFVVVAAARIEFTFSFVGQPHRHGTHCVCLWIFGRDDELNVAWRSTAIDLHVVFTCQICYFTHD